MLYAIHSGTRTIVGAADGMAEFYALPDETQRWRPVLHESVERPGFVDMLSDPACASLLLAPYVFVHADMEQRTAFERERGSRMRLLAAASELAAAQQRMLLGPGARSLRGGVDERSIAEIDGLDQNDPWDTRSAGQKAEDAERKAAGTRGAMSDESFAPDQPAGVDDGSDVHVSRIAVASDGKGGFEVVGASASKLGEASPAHGEAVLVDPAGRASVFHKVSVADHKLCDIMPSLALAGLDGDQVIAGRGDCAQGCWVAVVRGSTAGRIAALLAADGFSSEVSTVNRHAELLLPKGTSVAESVEEVERPRPWNARSGEIAAMDEAAREENSRSLAATEFLITGDYAPAIGRCRLFVTPASHFRASGELWQQPLDIARLLPPDMEEEAPGQYASRSRDWTSLCHDLTGRGFTESLLLRLHLNNL